MIFGLLGMFHKQPKALNSLEYLVSEKILVRLERKRPRLLFLNNEQARTLALQHQEHKFFQPIKNC